VLRFLPIFAALSVFAALLSQTLEAAAQDATAPHPRRARAMYLSQDHPAVLLDDDRVWIPSGLDQPLSVCAGARCAPVDRSESCEAPDCPGVGARVILRSAIASIDGFPTGREGFEAETQAMRVDAVLSQLSGYFGSHPDGSGGGGSSDAEGFSLFGAFGGAIATFDGGGGAFAGGTGTIGLRFAIDGDDVWDSRMLETLFGDRFTLSLRGSYLLATRGQSGGFVTTIGGSFEAENRVDDSAFQVPALLGVIVPEMGALFRDDLRATFYARWAVPIKVCFSRSAGLEIRPSVTVTEAPTGGAESIIAVELGGFVQ
jgi:hypothetical protein